jgi:hypothetical protein
VKIAIKYQVIESWNPRPFMVGLIMMMAPINLFDAGVSTPPKPFFQVRTCEIPVYYRNDSQQHYIEQEGRHFDRLL